MKSIEKLLESYAAEIDALTARYVLKQISARRYMKELNVLSEKIRSLLDTQHEIHILYLDAED